MNYSTYLRGDVRVPRNQEHCSAWNQLQRGTETDAGGFSGKARSGALSDGAPQLLGLSSRPEVSESEPGALASPATISSFQGFFSFLSLFF